jgi:hypothetical protein
LIVDEGWIPAHYDTSIVESHFRVVMPGNLEVVNSNSKLLHHSSREEIPTWNFIGSGFSYAPSSLKWN